MIGSNRRTLFVRAAAFVCACMCVAATASPAMGAHPGTNGRLAFSSYRDASLLDLYSMNADGTDVQRLTFNSRQADWSPTWSPDGTKIAYQGGSGKAAEIYVMNADGSGVRRLTTNKVEDHYPVWSPDGTRIAVSRTANRAQPDIYTFSAIDGSGEKRLTNNTADDKYPAWSPDSSQIAFVSTRDGNDEIYIMNADGSNVRRVTNSPTYDYGPDWSPDGTKLAFIRDAAEYQNYDIYSVNIDGTGLTQLTSGHYTGEEQPDWSPDGTKIAYVSYAIPYTSESGEIYVMNSDGTNRTRLTFNQVGDYQPDWQTLP